MAPPPRTDQLDEWVTRLREGAPDPAWDLFIGQYRRLIFAAIRHYTQDHDEVMDVFASACEALRADNLRRLRSYVDASGHSARFTTWLVTVVRNLTVDWFRHRDGRRRLGVLAESLPALQRQIFEHVFLGRQSHADAYELICSRNPPGPSFREFLSELRATYRALERSRGSHLPRELAPLPPPEAAEEPANAVEHKSRRKWLEGVLSSLEPADRVAVELYVVEELPAADIARILGLPNAKAVYNRVYRTLEGVRGRLKQAGIGPADL